MTFWPVLRTFKKDLNFTSRDSKELMAKGAFNLRKWNWNSSELLQLINKKEESIAQTKTEKTNAVVEEEDESFIKFSVGPTRTADTLVKTLGVCWNTATDEISFDSADWVCKHENNMRIIIEHMLTMSLLRKLSKVVKSFLGHNTSSLQNPPFFRILAFSWIYEVPTIVIGNTTDRYDLLNTLKKMAASVKSKQDARRSIFASVMAVSPRFSYFWKIPPYTLKRHRVKGCFWSGKHLLCEVYFLSFGYDDGVANRCNRFLVAEVREREGKPYF